MKICPDKLEVKWLTSGWPSLTSDDLKTWQFGTYAWCISKESWAPKDIICDNLSFLFLTIWFLMTMIWPLMTFFDLSTSRIVNIIIAKNIGMLHINWKLKTAVLQWKHVQTSERSNDWPQADLHWPLMTSKLSVSKLMHDVYQNKAEHPRISFVKTFFFCALPYDLSWPWLDLSWTFWTLKIEKLKINWI